MLFRHGDRSSISPHPFKDYDPSVVWPEGYGQLTQVGIEQHFLLGKWLSNEYSSFFSHSYNISTFRMRSSDVDRALMSSQAIMAGLFHKSPSSLDKYGLHWRPIPSHTVPKDSDWLLSLAPCARLTQRRNELMQKEEAQALFKEHEKTISTMLDFYGIKNASFIDIWSISDDLFCLRSHNATLPAFYTKEVAAELDDLTDKMFQIYFDDQESIKLSSGVFLRQSFNQMSSFISNETLKNPKDIPRILAFSAHDTNVAPLLGAFGAYANESKPAYASLVILELYAPSPDAPNEEFILKLRYKRGWKDNTSEYLQFSPCKGQRGAKQGCPFVVVRESVAPLFLTEEEAIDACKADWLSFRYRAIVVFTLGVFIVFLFCTLFAAFFISKRRQRERQLDRSFTISGEMPYSPLVSSPPTL
nr:lysosomal acid phosphatase [Hymenolepis microstoma]